MSSCLGVWVDEISEYLVLVGVGVSFGSDKNILKYIVLILLDTYLKIIKLCISMWNK